MVTIIIAKRIVPRTDEEILERLPPILCTVDGKKPDKEQLDKLYEFIKWYN